MSNFWSFVGGMLFVLTFQWVSTIPAMRKHRLKMALLARAKVYLHRAKFCESEQEALKYHSEIQELLNQVDKIK